MDDLLLWSKDRRFGLSISEAVLLEGVKECANAGSVETGGIIVGYYTPEHDCAIVTALGGPPEDSVRGARFFERGTKGIQRWISRLWREKRHFYLGEWHYHPGGAPVPSPDDKEQMQKFSKDRKLKCPEPILLIIGGDPQKNWSVNAYVYPSEKKRLQLFP